MDQLLANVSVIDLSFIQTWSNITTILICLVTFLTWIWYNNSRRPNAEHLPPGPTGFPFIGNLNLLYSKRNVERTFTDLSHKYGDLFFLQLGVYHTVVINNVELLRDAFLKQPDAFSNRPTFMLFFKVFNQSRGLIFQNGESQSVLRKLVVTSFRDFGVGKSTIEQRIYDELSSVSTELNKNLGKPVKLNILFHQAVSNIICSIVFGRRYEYTNKEFQKLLRGLKALFEIGGIRNVELFLPLITPLGLFFNPRFAKAGITANFSIYQFVKRRVQEHIDTYDKDNIRDFTDLYIQSKNEDISSSSTALTEENMYQSIIDLFFAGSETTSTSLLWAILYFMLHQDEQDKCRREILEIIGNNRPPTYTDKSMMPYTSACINEVQRLGNIAPIGVFRSTDRASNLGDYTIPKNSLVIVNMDKIHNDPEHWKEPHIFNPSRFLDSFGNLIKHPSFLPYGLGRRICLGAQMANIELFIVITSLLQRYKFTVADPLNPPTTEGITGFTRCPEQFEVVVEAV